MDSDISSQQNEMLIKKKISEIFQNNEMDFDHDGVNQLFQPTSQNKYQIEELRYQRFMTTQELLMDRFSKMESNVKKMEEMLEDNKKILRRTRFIEEKFWESKDFSKDDRVKKATYFAFFILLAVCVGMLIPYFKSEKLVFVDQNKVRQNPEVVAAEVEKVEVTSYISTNWVHIRDQANTKGKKVYTLGPNQSVEKLEEYGPWFKIRLYDYVSKKDIEGWVFAEFLSPKKN